MVSKYLTTMSHIMEPVIGCCPTMGLIPACLKTSRSSRKNSSTKLALSELNSIVSTSCSFCSLSTCVCVCMCVCMCVRVCARKTNTHAPIHMHAYTCIYTYMHTYVCTGRGSGKQSYSRKLRFSLRSCASSSFSVISAFGSCFI